MKINDQIIDEKDDWLSQERKLERSTSVWDMDDSAKVIKERHEAIHKMINENNIPHVPINNNNFEKINPSIIIKLIVLIYIILMMLIIIM